MKANQSIKYQKKIALCAIICAMSVLVLLIGAVVDVLDLTACGITMLFVSVIALEIGGYYPWLMWGVTLILSFFLLPNKFPTLLYLLLGFYPILKLKMERLQKVLAWGCKLVYFNIILTLLVGGTKYVLMMPDTDMDFSLPIYLIGNAAFVFFDLCMSTLLRFYFIYLRRFLGLHRFFRNE